VDTVQLHGGGLIIFLGAGGTNRSGQAGRTARWVLVDEFGKIKPLLTSKFDRRADAYDLEGRLVKAGTVENDDQDQMLTEYELSSRGRMHWRCHVCGRYGTLDWEQVDADWSSELSAAATVRIRCLRCGAPWTDIERQANLMHGVEVHHGQTVDDNGQVVGPLPETYTYGMRWSALDSPRRSLAKLASDFVLATHKAERGDTQALIDFYHDQLTRTYPKQGEDTQDLDISNLAARSAASNYDVVTIAVESGAQVVVDKVPGWVEFCTLAVDQSKRRLWYVIRGHDHDGRCAHLAWGRIPICGDLDEPSIPQRITALDHMERIRAAGLPTGHGAMAISIAGIDVGYEPDDTHRWISQNPHWIAVRGTGDRQMTGMQTTMPTGTAIASVPGWYQLREYNAKTGRSYQILWIDSDAVKTETARAFRRPLDATGAAWLPRGLGTDDHLLAHLAAEKWLKTPGGKFTWVKVARFADWWDCTYYTAGLARYLLDHYPERTHRLAAQSDAASDGPLPDDDAERGELGW
jgi:phage terminase large subunit GpA-like protein